MSMYQLLIRHIRGRRWGFGHGADPPKTPKPMVRKACQREHPIAPDRADSDHTARTVSARSNLEPCCAPINHV